MMAAVPNNLPYQLSSFIGREREIAEVMQLLAAERLVTLTGAGGCGKTRLALQVAATFARDDAAAHLYGDGVWLVELAALADPALVAQHVASILDVSEEPGSPRHDVLVKFVREKRLLLV